MPLQFRAQFNESYPKLYSCPRRLNNNKIHIYEHSYFAQHLLPPTQITVIRESLTSSFK